MGIPSNSAAIRRIGAVRNAGAAVAGGAVVAFIDADSEIHPETFNVIAAFMNRPDVVGGNNLVHRNDPIRRYCRPTHPRVAASGMDQLAPRDRFLDHDLCLDLSVRLVDAPCRWCA